LQFNKRDPILLVGDCHGGVTLVKLSPNLTIGGKVPAGFEGTVE
jgi:dynein intermediate chain 1